MVFAPGTHIREAHKELKCNQKRGNAENASSRDDKMSDILIKRVTCRRR